MTELSVKNLHVFRGERHLLKGLEFEVPRGVCLQVVGANGAGKTTLLRVLAGLLEPESLELRWRGGRVSPRDPEYHAALSYLGHDPPLKDDFSAVENVAFNVGLRRSVSMSEVHAALGRVGAQRFADLPARTLSAGQRRRVALAALRLTGANLWLLDEPVTNLDSAGQSLVASLIEEHLDQGGLVVAAIHQDLGLSSRRRTSLNVGTGEVLS
ncbi:MAG: cytochrome c biogenesis heme-transporting ATPase CcmA [Gammaproteobacteria bacterium]